MEIVNSCSYFKFLGMECVYLREGSARVKLVTREDHLNPGRVVQGGVITSIVDAAGTLAGMSLADTADELTTADIKLNFLSAVRVNETIIGEAQVVQKGRTLCVSELEARTEDGRLIAKGLTTCVVLKGFTSWVKQE
jgi:uncharacterized protein (TIGR00369 family)